MQKDTSFTSFLRERILSREPAGVYTIWMHANPDYYDDIHHMTNILAIDPNDFDVAWKHSSLTYQCKGQIVNHFKSWEKVLKLKMVTENITMDIIVDGERTTTRFNMFRFGPSDWDKDTRYNRHHNPHTRIL